MAVQVQTRRGTTAEHSSFTGANGEITVDTDKEVVVVHDGATAGGYPLMRENGSNSALALGSAGTPSLKFTGDINTGIYSPGADQVGITTGGTNRLLIDSTGQIEAVSLGSASAPTYSFTTDPNTGIYSPGADQVAVATNGTGRLFVNSSGSVGIGTSAPMHRLNIAVPSDASLATGVDGFLINTLDASSISRPCGLLRTGSSYSYLGVGANRNCLYSNGTLAIQSDSGAIEFCTGNSLKAVLDSSGRLGIGTTAPGQLLEIHGASNPAALVKNTTSNVQAYFYASATAGIFGTPTVHPLVFNVENLEKARIDTSGRLLVGTSSSRSNAFGQAAHQVEGGSANAFSSVTVAENSAFGGAFVLAKSRGTAFQVLSSGDALGILSFQGADGSALKEAARIEAFVDGTPGANDMPGRLVFSTTADGASSPTERMRIQASGDVRFANGDYVFPSIDNTIELGSGSNRWQAVWAANGTIQTSDKRTKTDIADAALGSDFIKSLRPVSYKWIDGGKRDTGERDKDNNYIYESVPGTRTHWGFIAQEVKQAVDDAGVDFGGWVLTDKDDPDSQQALRYDQFIAPLTKALQETMAELEALKAEVAALKAS